MLTHVSDDGRPKMVNVGGKRETARLAVAQSVVTITPEMAALFSEGDLRTKKGPVFHTAIVAGTMAVKKTSELIPFCHPLAIEGCDITIRLDPDNRVVIECAVSLTGKTGVEMEALTGASVAALTVYDMCKSMGHAMVISETRLLEKRGGKSDVQAR